MISRPCKDCRWISVGWFRRFVLNDYLDAICVNPTVVQAAPRASEQGWLLPGFSDGGPIHDADPVTGAPERVELPCRIARSSQYRGLAGDRGRADANCGPEGRYWEPRK